jgi:hypothetical protein
MGVKLGIPKEVEVEAKEIRLYMKVCDEFSGTLHDQDGNKIAEYEGYVPCFFPGKHYGDYMILNIDLETGMITNWETPDASELKDTFFPKSE